MKKIDYELNIAANDYLKELCKKNKLSYKQFSNNGEYIGSWNFSKIINGHQKMTRSLLIQFAYYLKLDKDEIYNLYAEYGMMPITKFELDILKFVEKDIYTINLCEYADEQGYGL